MADTGRADRILDAAAELIAHYGVDKTTVDDIARAARVSKGAIYLHYRSKEALVEALIMRESGRAIQEIMERLEADPDGGTIFSFYKHAVMVGLDNPVLYALFTNDMRVLGDMARRWKEQGFNEQRYSFAVVFVQQLQEANLLRTDLSAEVITCLLLIVRYGLLSLDDFVPAGHKPPLDTLGPAIADLLQRGLAPPDGGDKQAGKQAFAQLMAMVRQLMEQYQQHQHK